MLNGGYNNTLDEKGRVTFPAAFARALPSSALVITRGLEQCLWTYSPEKWRDFAGRLEVADPMKKDVRRVQRHFLGWAVDAEIDRSSRLAIPQSLREYAGLKRDCVIIGVGQRIEIWDAAVYKSVNDDGGGEGLADAAEHLEGLF